MTAPVRTLLFSCLILLAACASEPRVPDDILPPRRMKEVLHEVFLADDWVQQRRDSDTAYSRADSSIVLYRGILKRHKIPEEQFKKSFRYYEQHPEQLKEVLDAMQAPVPVPINDGGAPTQKL